MKIYIATGKQEVNIFGLASTNPIPHQHHSPPNGVQ
jgi:hypothetical protein